MSAGVLDALAAAMQAEEYASHIILKLFLLKDPSRRHELDCRDRLNFVNFTSIETGDELYFFFGKSMVLYYRT